MSRLNIDVPDPIMIASDQEARQLLQLAMRKVETDRKDFIGFDTETHGKKILIKKKKDGSASKDNPLDWMRDTITFWSLSFKLGNNYQRYCLDQQHFQFFAPLLECPIANIVTWNGKYDAHVSWNSGVNVWESKFMDFQVAGQMLNENVQMGGMDLKKAARRGFTREHKGAIYTRRKLTDDQKMRAIDDIVPWSEIPMTKFRDIFGDKDVHGNRAVEYVTSLYDLPVDLVSNYASLDAYSTLRLAEHMRQVMEAHDISDTSGYETMWEYFVEFEVLISEILWRMERRGLCVDVEALEAKINPLQEELDEIQEEINKFAQDMINLDAPEQVAKLLFGRGEGTLGLTPTRFTAGGNKGPQPSTDETTLNKLAAEGVELVQRIMRYRKVTKIKGTYVEALARLARWHEDGRIHPEFKHYGARTGRFSTKTPNSQNFPRPDEDEFGIRSVFVAREGYILIVADYEQLEMRIMAHFSQDPSMLEAINTGKDLHAVSVERMFGIPYDEVVAAKKKGEKAKEQWGRAWKEHVTEHEFDCILKRQQCKTTGFAILYGAGAERVSALLEIPKEEAQLLVDAFFRAYPGVKGFMNENLRSCRRLKFVVTILGRRRNLPEINNPMWSTRSGAEREANNSVIQGSAADIVKAAMINCERCPKLKRMGVELVNQIHDELVFEAPKQFADIAIPMIKGYMQTPFVAGEHPLDVPTPASVHKAENWAVAK